MHCFWRFIGILYREDNCLLLLKPSRYEQTGWPTRFQSSSYSFLNRSFVDSIPSRTKENERTADELPWYGPLVQSALQAMKKIRFPTYEKLCLHKWNDCNHFNGIVQQFGRQCVWTLSVEFFWTWADEKYKNRTHHWWCHLNLAARGKTIRPLSAVDMKLLWLSGFYTLALLLKNVCAATRPILLIIQNAWWIVGLPVSLLSWDTKTEYMP